MYYMALHPNHHQLYAVDLGEGGVDNQGSVLIINTDRNSDTFHSLLDTIDEDEDLGIGYPYQIAFNPTGTTAYLAITKAAGPTVTTDDNRLAVINTNTHNVTRIDISGDQDYGPVGVVVSADGEYIYTEHRGLGRIDAIRIDGTIPIQSVGVGRSPMGLAVNEAGTYLYVANTSDNTVAVIDISDTPNLIETIELTDMVSGSHSIITLNTAGTRAYVTSTSSKIAVIKLDPETGLSTGEPSVSYIEPGPTVLVQLAISPDGERALVANNTRNVLIIDLINDHNVKVGEVDIGHSSFGVVYTEGLVDGVVAYVSGGGTVTAILELPDLP